MMAARLPLRGSVANEQEAERLLDWLDRNANEWVSTMCSPSLGPWEYRVESGCLYVGSRLWEEFESEDETQVMEVFVN